MKRLMLWLFSLAALVIVPAAAFAQIPVDPTSGTGTAALDDQHVDRSVILWNGGRYYDSQIDNDYTYLGPKDANGCQPKINNLSSGNTKADLISYTFNKTTGNCESHKQQITLSDAQAADWPFIYIDQNHIQTSDGAASYTFDQSLGEYLEDGGDRCKDIVKITKPAYGGQFATASVTASTAGSHTTYDHWADELDYNTNPTNIAQVKDGCTIYNPRNYGVNAFALMNDPAFQNAASNSAGGSTQTGGGPNGTAGNQPECDGGSFSWIACPIIELTLDGIKKTQAILVKDFLTITPIGTGDPAYPAWKAFLSVADILFVLIFMVAVFGAAIGFDNYAVKKTLPRLIAAAVLMQASYFIATIGVDVGNILGAGITDLIPTPHGSAQFDLTSTGGFLTAGAFTTAVIAGGAALIGLSFATVAAMGLAFLVVVATLLIRKALIILLIVLSPIAIMAWVLPNTENIFKRWYKELTRLILMYPLIMLLFAAGKLFAGSIQDTTSNGLTPLLQLAALAMPLFLVPSTLKASGALMGFAAGRLSKGGAMGAKKIGDSKWAEKRAEERQRNNLARATDPNAGFIKKGIASQRAGFGFRPSQNSQLKMAASAADIRKKDVAGAAESFRNEGITPGDTDKLKELALNGKTEAQRVAAMQMLGKTPSGRKALEGIKASMMAAGGGTMSASGTRIWNEGLEPNMKDIASKTPQLLSSPEAAFGKPTSEKVAEWDTQTLQDAIDHWSSLPADSPERLNASAALQGIATSPGLRNKMERESRQLLFDKSELFSPNARAAITENINADGSVRMVQPSTPAPGTTVTPVGPGGAPILVDDDGDAHI